MQSSLIDLEGPDFLRTGTAAVFRDVQAAADAAAVSDLSHENERVGTGQRVSLAEWS